MMCQFLLYNKVNQLYIYIHPHVSSLLRLPPILPIPPLQGVTKHRADLPVLCGCFPLAISFTFGSVYMSMPLSHFVPAYPSTSPCPQVHSLRLRLYSCPAPRFFFLILVNIEGGNGIFMLIFISLIISKVVYFHFICFLAMFISSFMNVFLCNQPKSLKKHFFTCAQNNCMALSGIWGGYSVMLRVQSGNASLGVTVGLGNV